MKNKIKNILKSIGMILLYLVIIPGITYAIFLPKGLNGYSNKSVDLRLLITEIIMFLIFLIIFRKDLINDFKNLKYNFKEKLKIGFKYWLIGLGIMIACNFVINIILFSGSIAANEEANRQVLTEFPFYAFGALIIMGPIIEEMVFRLNFKKIITNQKIYVIVTSIIFAAVHLLASVKSFADFTNNWQQLLYLFPYAALGWCFAKVYTKTNNIWISMIMHIIQNSMSILIILLSL